MIDIYGFSLLRNGVKYDYSFKESFRSLEAVTKSLYLALGDSEDSTEAELSFLKNLKIIPTVWDESLRKGGLILSQQTNIALNALREDQKENDKAWGVYLQADEVLHEEDRELLKEDLQKAHDQGCDAVTFRYYHFWMDHHHVAINKKWYPQEIRAVKLNTPIESWGDAQSFRNHTQVYESDVRVFHYGHVREDDAYKIKKKDILKLYHSDEKLPKYKRREKRFDNQTECLLFFGNHPLVMKERIERFGEPFFYPDQDVVYICGDQQEVSKEFIEKISAKEVQFVSSLNQVPKKMRKKAIIIRPGFFQKMINPTHVPPKMKSKLANPWPNEVFWTFKLSEKGIGLRPSL